MTDIQVALKHCKLELRIEHTYVVITTLLLRPSTLSFPGHSNGRHRRIWDFSAGLEGRAAWMMKGELELLLVCCTETGCLRTSLLSNTETLYWRKVYLLVPQILNNKMVKGLSIPIVRNNRVVKGISIAVLRNNRFCDMSIGTCFTKQ